MVIAATSDPPQFAGMAIQPEKLITEGLLSEMRPERVGHRLKLLRLALGMSPSEMADTLGIERTYWSRFENGRRGITEPFAVLLVDKFGVTLDFIILGRWATLPLELAQRMRAMDVTTN